MAQRLRLFDLRVSRLPKVVGLCADDVPSLCGFVNTAQRRLLYAKEAGDEGWWGTFAEIAFNVSKDLPYITLPREVARLESVNVCQRPVPVQNQFFEYLMFGNGRLPKSTLCPGSACPPIQVLSRNNAVLFTDITAPSYIAFYPTEQQDVNKRVFVQGIDNNGVRVISQDTFDRVGGIFVNLAFPFVAAPMQFNAITGLQKDVTAGPVHVFEINPSTGVQTLILTMEPSETTAWYRRYYLDSLPISCCPTPPSGTACQLPVGRPIQVTAIAKLDLIPVVTDTDYCLIQNIEAIINECQAIRYSQIDDGTSKQMEDYHHREAIRALNGELVHYLGARQPAVAFSPFGTARLERQSIGSLI